MKKALRIIIFVLVMGTVSAGMLAGINLYTAPLIAKNEELRLKSSVMDALEVVYSPKEIIPVFDKNVRVEEKDKYKFFKTADGAVAFEFYGPGLWGPISGIISLEKDLRTIRRINVVHQEETPGLGGRIAEGQYLAQFKRKEVLPQIKFMPEGQAAQKNEVDSITGATGSSRAFEKIINANVQKYLAVLKD